MFARGSRSRKKTGCEEVRVWMAGVGEERARASCAKDSWRSRTSGERGLRGGREKAGWKWRERERQWGVEKTGEGRGDVVGSN